MDDSGAQTDAVPVPREGAAADAGLPVLVRDEAAGLAALPVPGRDDPRAGHIERIARAGLEEFAPAARIGELEGIADQGDGVFSVRFQAIVPGCPGWLWTASMTQLEGEEPSVLEAGLLPGPQALLAPPWTPWAERLAEYEANRAGEAQADESGDAQRSGSDAAGQEHAESGASSEEASSRSSRRRQRRLRTRLRRGEHVAAQSEEEAAGAGPLPGEGVSVDAVPGEAEEYERDADPGRRSARRRVVVSRADGELAESDPTPDEDGFVVVEDVREFADDMDDVLDGVEFEGDGAED